VRERERERERESESERRRKLGLAQKSGINAKLFVFVVHLN
jgi:hypothetical protein